MGRILKKKLTMTTNEWDLSNQGRPAYRGQSENDQWNNSPDNTAFDSRDHLPKYRAIGGQLPSSQQYVRWGIAWEGPTFMIWALWAYS